MADPFDQELTPNLSSRVGSYRPDRLRILPEHCDCKWKTDPLPIEESPHGSMRCCSGLIDAHWHALDEFGNSFSGLLCDRAMIRIAFQSSPIRSLPFASAARAIRNRNTRLAYARACWQFFDWCRAHGLELTTVRPFHVAAWIEDFPGSKPTIKLKLAEVRMLYDFLVVRQIIRSKSGTFRSRSKVCRQERQNARLESRRRQDAVGFNSQGLGVRLTGTGAYRRLVENHCRPQTHALHSVLGTAVFDRKSAPSFNTCLTARSSDSTWT